MINRQCILVTFMVLQLPKVAGLFQLLLLTEKSFVATLLVWALTTRNESQSRALAFGLFPRNRQHHLHNFPSQSHRAHGAVSQLPLYAPDNHDNDSIPMAVAVDSALCQRYACTRFQRFDGNLNSTKDPSPSNQTVVRMAVESLDMARRAPSSFNAQAYKMVIVSSPQQKSAVAQHCAGKNAFRVRDSDCTIVFLADKETGKSFHRFQKLLQDNNPSWIERRWAMVKLKCILALFSSGYPLLPRILAAPISFGVRLGVSISNLLFGRWIVFPTLSSAETWSTKNVMLVAMAYMIGCSARGITTCPMEGINASGIRKVLGIPRRYSIPLIIATGNAYQRPSADPDDVGMDHGGPGTKTATPRYDRDEMIFDNKFGKAVQH